MKIELETIKKYLLLLQQDICNELEILDGKALFINDKWERPEGGGG